MPRPIDDRGNLQSLRPGDFPIGSIESRAAARRLLEQQQENASAEAMVLTVCRADRQRSLSTEQCMAVLRRSGALKRSTGCVVVRLTEIPEGLTAEQEERWIIGHVREIVGPR